MRGLDGPHGSAAQELGSALKELQRRSGRTLRSLESEVMISDSSLSRYLRGSTVPPWSTVRDLCRALGADPSEYRALWEAADRCQPQPPAVAGAAAEGRWRRVRRTAGRRLSHRWVWAACGACAGLVCGGALALFGPWGPDTVPRHGTQGGQAVSPKAVAGTSPRLDDHSRIFVNRVTGNCLDHSLDKGLRSFAPNGLSYQKWTVHPYPDGTSELRNHATGACLDSGDSALQGASCSKAVTQKWLVTPLADASVEIRSRTTGACLDDGDQGLRAVPCDGSDHQKWG